MTFAATENQMFNDLKHDNWYQTSCVDLSPWFECADISHHGLITPIIKKIYNFLHWMSFISNWYLIALNVKTKRKST